MTTNSTRRAAEMAVINAACKYVTTWGVHDRVILCVAVLEYEGLGLDTTSRSAFSNNSTDTSAEAGATMRDIVGGLEKQCYDEILANFHNGAVGLTVDALEQLLAGSHQSISPRLTALRDKGWVVDSGITRKTRSGRKAIVWTPSVMALQL